MQLVSINLKGLIDKGSLKSQTAESDLRSGFTFLGVQNVRECGKIELV